MTVEYLNGVSNHYGPRGVEDVFGGEIKTNGKIRQFEYDFNYDDYPTASTNGSMNIIIPAYSVIISCRLYTTVDFATGTALEVGLEQADGTEIDSNGLVTATEGALANLDLGKWVIGNGALIGATTGAADGQLMVVGTGTTMTAGSARIVLEFMQDKAV